MKMLFYLLLCLISASVYAGKEKEDSPGIPEERSQSISEPNGILTLNHALTLALLHNPQLAAYSWEVRAAEARTLQAGFKPNPTLDIEVEEVGGSGPRRGFDGAETTVQISQQIERSGKAAKRKNAATLDHTLADWDYQSMRLDVLAQTRRAFIDVLAAQQKLHVTAQLLDLAKQQVYVVTQRVEAGKDAPLEQNKAEIILAQVRIQHAKAANLLQNARHQLAACWNRPEPAFASADGRLNEMGPIPAFEQLAGQLIQNPDLARWADEIDRAKAQETLERAQSRQDWTVSAGMQRFNESDENAVVFGLSIPLPIFDRNQGNIAAARYKTRKTEQQQKAAQAHIHAQLAQAYEALTSSHTEVREMQDNILKNAERAYKAAGELYREGKTDYLSVLDAQRTFFDVQTQYLEALTEFHKASADTARLTGRTTAVDITDTKEQIHGK